MEELNGTPESKLENFLAFNSADPVEYKQDNTDIYDAIERFKPVEPKPQYSYDVAEPISTPAEKLEKTEGFKVPEKEPDEFIPANSVVDSIKNLNIDSKEKLYLIKLADKESKFNPNAKNRYGYIGLYQFHNPSLKTVGISKQEYKTDINKQHEAALKLAQINWNILRPFHHLIGKTIKGITITKYGLMAASHLIGAGNVIKFLRSNGSFDKADGNGTKCSSYLKSFSNIG